MRGKTLLIVVLIVMFGLTFYQHSSCAADLPKTIPIAIARGDVSLYDNPVTNATSAGYNFTLNSSNGVVCTTNCTCTTNITSAGYCFSLNSSRCNMYMLAPADFRGNVAAGYWWIYWDDDGTQHGNRLPMDNISSLVVNVSAMTIQSADYCNDNSSTLRLAIVMMLDAGIPYSNNNPNGDKIVYAEIDFWDDPCFQALYSPEGLHSSDNSCNFRFDNLSIEQVRDYSIDFMPYIDETVEKLTGYPLQTNASLLASYVAIDNWGNSIACQGQSAQVQFDNYSVTVTLGDFQNEGLAVRGLDDRIYYRYESLGKRSDWLVLPTGSTIDSPACAMLNDEVYFVVRGSDGNSLWWGCLSNPEDPATFSGWTLLDGATDSAPTLVSNGTTLGLFVRGLDNRVYYRFYNGSWGQWLSVPTGTTCDSPSAVMCGNNLQIVVRGMDGSSLWNTIVSCDGAVVRGWSLLSGATPSTPVLECSNADSLCLIVRGMDNAIYYQNYTGSIDSWGDWSAFPTGTTIDGPGATVIGNMLCTVVRGSDGNTLWCGSLDLSTSNFLGWTLLDGATPSAPTLTS